MKGRNTLRGGGLVVKDQWGRIPFALIGVLILLLANFSALYVISLARHSIEAASAARELKAMEGVANLVHREVELEAHYTAMEAIRRGTQLYFNDSMINREFLSLLTDATSRSFPREVQGYRIDIEDIFGLVVLRNKATYDSVSLAKTQTEVIDGEQTESLSTELGGEWSNTSKIAYYSLVGFANITVEKGGLKVARSFNFDSELESPYPLIKGSLEQIQAISEGANSEMGRIVRYILGSLAQYRVLEGYGGGDYGAPAKSVGDILTLGDIERAVNVALMLEEVKRFRELDWRAAEAFDLENPRPPSQSLTNLLMTYVDGGVVDPADLLALNEGLDSSVVHLNKVLAQAIAALLDQGVIKYLDYFGITGLADITVQLIEALARAIDEFLQWIANTNKKAELVTRFVSDLFSDLEFDTYLLGPHEANISSLQYSISNEDGSTHNISISAFAGTVPFGYHNIVHDNEGIWEHFYDDIFQNDLKSAHSGIRDFVNDLASQVANDINLIGAVPNPSLAGNINPKDEQSLLEFVESALTSAMDDALFNLRSNPSYLKYLIGNVWEKQIAMVRNLTAFIRVNYESFVDKDYELSMGGAGLRSQLYEKAKEDPDFKFLDAGGRDALNVSLAADIVARGWVEIAWDEAVRRDTEEMEALFDRAASLDTPPEHGGIYRRIEGTVLDATGVLSRAGELMKSYATELIRGKDIANAKILLNVSRAPYVFWDEKETQSGRGVGKAEPLRVRQTPTYLKAVGSRDTSDDLSSGKGDLLVRITEPTEWGIDANSPNVHFTRLNETFQRPFQTSWYIDVKGRAKLDVATANAVYLSPRGHEPAYVSQDIYINISFRIDVFSGWPLEGVQYTSSNTFGGDVWNIIVEFLNAAWNALTRIWDWIVDGITKILDLLVGILDTLLSFANRVLEALSQVMRYVIELLQGACKGFFGFLGAALDVIADLFGKTSFSLSVFGLTFFITLNKDEATRLSVGIDGEDFNISADFVNLEKLNLTGKEKERANATWDVISQWHLRLWDFSFDSIVDPLMVLQEHIVEGHGQWGQEWGLDLQLPVIETYVEKTHKIEFPTIPTPFGTLDLEVGMSIRLFEELEGIDLVALLDLSYAETKEALAGEPLSFEYVTTFTTTLAQRFIDNVVSAVRANIERVKEATLYVQGTFKAGATAGVGFRLAFVSEGFAILHAFDWIIDNLSAYFNSLTNPNVPAQYYSLPATVPEHLFIRGEIFAEAGMPRILQHAVGTQIRGEYRIFVRIQANVPVFGVFIGANWGKWRIDFGVYIERVPKEIADPLFGTGDKEPDLWIFKGAVYALS